MMRLSDVIVCFAGILSGGFLSVQAANPAFTVHVLGTETPSWTGTKSASGQYAGDVFAMTAAGHDFYWCWDRGGFAYIEASGDFSFSCRLKTAPDVASKVGINVREKLTTASRDIDLRYDYYHDPAEWTWYARLTEGTVGSSGSLEKSSCQYIEGSIAGFTEASGVYMEISRKSQYYTLSVKKGSGEWIVVKDGLRLATDKVYVGLSLASGSKGAFPASAEWDNIQYTPGVAAASSAPRSVFRQSVLGLKPLFSANRIVLTVSNARNTRQSTRVYAIDGRRILAK